MDVKRFRLETLHRQCQVADYLARQALAAAGVTRVTERQISVLLAVRAHQPCSQAQLVEITGIDRATLGNIAERLTKLGDIKRPRNGKDRRAYTITLTRQGRDTAATVWSVMQALDPILAEALVLDLGLGDARLEALGKKARDACRATSTRPPARPAARAKPAEART